MEDYLECQLLVLVDFQTLAIELYEIFQEHQDEEICDFAHWQAISCFEIAGWQAPGVILRLGFMCHN